MPCVLYAAAARDAYAEGSIVGGTNRTLALMTTLKTVIEQLSEDG